MYSWPAALSRALPPVYRSQRGAAVFGANLRASAHMNSASTDERRAVLLTVACRLRFIDGTDIVFEEVSGRSARTGQNGEDSLL